MQGIKNLLTHFSIKLLVCLFCFFAKDLSADILYGTIGDAGSGGPDTLVVIDQNTGGVERTIGPIGYIINGLAYDPTTGNLYATSSDHDPFTGLLTIDTTTGAGTPIGPGWSGVAILVCLACDSTGQLYAWNEFLGATQDDLASVNKVTGTFAMFPDSTIDTGPLGLDFDASNTLWLVNYDLFVYTVNTTTGLATYSGFPIASLAHHGKFHPQTGQYWGIDQKGGANPRNIVIFDPTTWTMVNTLPTVNDLHTLAFVPEDLTVIKGKQGSNRFMTETEYFNEIEWVHSTSAQVVVYNVYRNGTLIAQVPPTTFSYIDHNQKRHKPVEYSVNAIYADGSESARIFVIIK